MTKREKILALADGTRTAKEIAAEVGCHEAYVGVACRRERLGMGHRAAWSKEEWRAINGARDRAIRVLYQLGASYREIGSQFNISYERVRQIISRGID